MIIKNVKIFTKERKFIPGEVALEQGMIRSVTMEDEIVYSEKDRGVISEDISEDEQVLDGRGAYCFPGMIDLHFHGCKGYDFCDGTREALHEIAKYEASIGVTAIAPATLTLPVEELERVLACAADYRQEQENRASGNRQEQKSEAVGGSSVCAEPSADLVGVNMEGPFISIEKKGAQDERNIISCDAEIFRRFQKAAKGLVKFIGIAPERNSAAEFISAVKGEVTVSLAHTNAGYDAAKEAFDTGAGHVVHLYNAMSPFTHRDPGVIGAAADSKHVDAEIICDGVHIHPSAVRNAFRMFGADRMVLISDSIRATGMPDGDYTLGGLDVHVGGRYARLAKGGALAGSVTTLPDCVRTAVKEMQIPLETAIACATINPAKSLGIDDAYGSIEPGKKADLVLWGEDLQLQAVIKDGAIL